MPSSNSRRARRADSAFSRSAARLSRLSAQNGINRILSSTPQIADWATSHTRSSADSTGNSSNGLGTRTVLSKRTPPRVRGRRPSRTGDRATKRAQCAALTGLGVNPRRPCDDANPRRHASLRRASRGCPVLLVLGTSAGRTDLLCWSGLGLLTFYSLIPTPRSVPPQGCQRFDCHPPR